MNEPMTMYAIMVPLLVLMVWRRISRQFGRQPIRRTRMIVRIAILAVVGALLALTGLRNVALAEGLVGGVLLGAAIGLIGLRLTTWVNDPQRGDCYIPNRWIGALLTAVLLGRLAWRFLVVWPQLEHASEGGAQMAVSPWEHTSTPLTLLVFGLLIGYYIVYYSGLLVHHRRFVRAHAGEGSPTHP